MHNCALACTCIMSAIIDTDTWNTNMNPSLPTVLLLCLGTGLANAQDPGGSPLEGTSWQLVRIEEINDTRFTPEDPAKYVIRFRAQGRLQIDSDCNRASGQWLLQNDRLSFANFTSSQGMCPPGSLHNRFVMHLRNVQTATQNGDSLTLSTTLPNVTLHFEPFIFRPGSR